MIKESRYNDCLNLGAEGLLDVSGAPFACFFFFLAVSAEE